VIGVKAEWQPGARTTAWDALWRQILADLNLETEGDPDRYVIESAQSLDQVEATARAARNQVVAASRESRQ
jgi:hypothetical protein